jgi:hypothetical protein
MKQIAKNSYYELAYDESKNRVYWTMKGFWEKMSVVPDFDKDWDAIESIVKSGFTIFADLSTLKAMPEGVKSAQDKRQARLMKAGCAKVGCLIENTAAKFGLNQAVEKNGMAKILKYCSTKAELEAFLNS